MSQELYKLLPFLQPVSGSADTTAEQKTQALQRKSAEQIRQGGGLTGQTKTKELYKLFPFLQTAASKPQSSSSGNITRVGGKTYRMDNPEDVKALNAVLAADKASRPGQQFADLRGGGGGMTTQTPPATGGLDTGSGNRDAKLDPNATEQYASNFKAGQANMDQIQDMYSGETKYKDTGKTALQLWAKANPALAQKEFTKAETRALKPGGELYGYDTMDTFKPIDIPEADRQNPIDQATALGGNLTIDAQTFADKKIEDTMAQIRDEGITDMSLSDTLNLDIPSKLFLSDEDTERLSTGFDSNSLPLTGVNPSSFFDMKGSFPQPDIAPSLYGSYPTVDRPYLMK